MISVSLLTTYLYCKRKLFLQEVLKLVEVPKDVVILGSIRHECYDKINKAEEELVKNIKKELSLEELQQQYKSRYSVLIRNIIINNKKKIKNINLDLAELFKRIWPEFLIESSIRARNVHNFLIKNKIYGEELWQKLSPKIHSEYYINSEELGLKGIIDKLEFYEDDIIPFELKTGKVPERGVWENHKIQIAAYLLLLEKKFNKEINIGYIKYLDANEDRAVIFNPFLRDQILILKNNVECLLNSKELPDFCNNEKKCSSCGLKKQCNDEKFLNKKLTKSEFKCL